jgi:hypothetical protein
MIAVQYPQPQFRTRTEEGKRFIFDAIRKTWLLLTDEEWVRQNFVSYLITALDYPSSMIALEKEIRLNELKKRFDILVYDGRHQPWMMIECKSPDVGLNEGVLQQVLRYNISTPVRFIIITNGTNTIGWKKENGSLTEVMVMPTWEGK